MSFGFIHWIHTEGETDINVLGLIALIFSLHFQINRHPDIDINYNGAIFFAPSSCTQQPHSHVIATSKTHLISTPDVLSLHLKVGSGVMERRNA